MTTTPPDAPKPPKAVRPKNPPLIAQEVMPERVTGQGKKFVPTEEQRKQVRALAKTMKAELPQVAEWIANRIGISRSTLYNHFKADLDAGRAELIASLGATMVGIAMGTITDVSKERMEAIKFTLARMGGWSAKVELSGPGGGAIETRQYNLGDMDEERKRALLSDLDMLLGDRATENETTH